MVKPKTVINSIPGFKLDFTARAASKLSKIYTDSNEILRIGVQSGGCHGFQYNLDLVPENAKETNEVDEFASNLKQITYVMPDQGKVVIDEDSLKILNNATLNYTTELIGSQFKIENGELKSSCGCGTSFDIKDKSQD